MTYTIILGVTGSIAAYKACEITTRLVKSGVEVVVVMTDCAQHFVTPLTFRTLSNNKVVTGLFGQEEVHDPYHVSLSDRADLILIAPATANVIGQMASGIADDVLTCTVLASKARVLLAPAMDDRMYSHPVVQGNIQKLKAIGYRFIGPVEGRLSSGRIGVGRMADVEDIVRAVQEELKALPSKPQKEAGVKGLSGKSKG
ncbi:MAG: flavoprotein [Candidatus Brocadiaceae bacterium]|nr:flavoprotein [Candidatus Brocadiaceae bacterium]